MPILSRESAKELQRIIKESTGRKISLGEAYGIWHYLIKLLQLLWGVDKRHNQKPGELLKHPSFQPGLFDKLRKKKDS
jgi:hypothetical protein